MNSDSVKVLFSFYSDVLEEETIETMWAIPIDVEGGLYKLDSIPFYAPSLATGDIFFAEHDEQQGMLTYRDTIKYSGNSNIWVIIMVAGIDIEDIRRQFQELGCESEKLGETYFAMEIPRDIKYHTVQKVLKEYENAGTISYSESCLSNEHRI